ncbi:40S ribosomal protein S7 [Nymphaea thermarum]|nr:40S ribosomal protein S7 [Nymphaea thermarum]
MEEKGSSAGRGGGERQFRGREEEKGRGDGGGGGGEGYGVEGSWLAGAGDEPAHIHLKPPSKRLKLPKGEGQKGEANRRRRAKGKAALAGSQRRKQQGQAVRMYTARRKIQKDKGADPSEFEETVAQAFFDLENTNQELKSDLKDLFINSAVQIDISGNRKAVVIHVPYRLRKAFRKIHVRLVRELEKKFSGKDVILIASRRILRPPKKGSAVIRPRSRTLTAVHEAILEDVVYPAEIVGKRIRYRLDGSKIMKVYLDPKERNNTEYKLETFSGVYRKLSGKDVVFEYPITETA